MKTAVSNLAWGGGFEASIVEALLEAGVLGVELAPTAIWPEAPSVDDQAAASEAAAWRACGLPVVGIQSLLYGHPDLRLFEPATHPALRAHLTNMIKLGGALGGRVAVFGSPRNRLRGGLPQEDADSMASEFLGTLETVLSGEGITLTLEPNAPGYGADYLTTYADCVRLADLIGSPWIAPQIDTGCLRMVGVDSAESVIARTPAHVHVSAPDMAPPPDDIDHTAIASALLEVQYAGWVTLEMRVPEYNPLAVLFNSAAWLVSCYGSAG